MKRTDFRRLVSSRVVVFDGAMGTMLQGALPDGLECPELAVEVAPQVLRDIHRRYAVAGCTVVQTNTFGANRVKLGIYGHGERVAELNKASAQLARSAVVDFPDVLIAGDIGSTGKLLAPLGALAFAEAVDVYREQAAALVAGGVDLILIETMTDVHEAKAAVMGVREVCDLPVIVSMTFDEDMRTLTGATPEVAAVVLDALDIDALAANCGFGPDMFVEILRRYRSVTDLPLLAQPNAGLPQCTNGVCFFTLSPVDMAQCVGELVEAGAAMLGGCCGTTPEHLELMVTEAQKLVPTLRVRDGVTRLAGATAVAQIGDGPTRIIGECINVSARKDLVEAVRTGNYAPIADEAMEQVAAGADVVDVNMGLKLQGVTETDAMVHSLYAVQRVCGAAVAIDSVDHSVMEAALQAYRGKPLINSTNGDDAHLDATLALARKYGAAVLGLTLDHNGIPPTAAARLAIAQKIVRRAEEFGLRREDMLIDTLTLTAGSKQDMVGETLGALRLVREQLGVRTVLGVSNISHGLPNRPDLTGAFLVQAIHCGLDMPIANPKLRTIQAAMRTADVLTGRDKNSARYIEWATANAHDAQPTHGAMTANTATEIQAPTLMTAIIKGDANAALGFARALRETSVAAAQIVNEHLIPALDRVGERYEKRQFFLPQLLAAADAAQATFDLLADDLAATNSASIGTYVLATVKGDMHDIGKNIVAIMLRNHGFRVIDLGRDVDADTIVDTAIRERADIIGLSSLMTTTMGEMELVAQKLKDNNATAIALMIGGAVITPDYADMVGAHYAADAVNAVRVAKGLLGK